MNTGLIIIVVVFFVIILDVVCEKPNCIISRTSYVCRGVSGQFLPQEYSPHLHYLYIVESDLTSLTAEDFSLMPNVLTLHIDSCTIPITPETSLFSAFSKLETLEITRSNVSENFDSLFANNTELITLFLLGNNIRRINKDVFNHLKSIQTIDMSLNEISEIYEDDFTKLPSLKELVLRNNKIGEKFNPAYLWQSSSECIDCTNESFEATCPDDVRQEGNGGVDSLWMTYNSKAAIFLEGNSVCAYFENIADRGEEGKEHDMVPGQHRLLDARRKFLFKACSSQGWIPEIQDLLETSTKNISSIKPQIQMKSFASAVHLSSHLTETHVVKDVVFEKEMNVVFGMLVLFVVFGVVAVAAAIFQKRRASILNSNEKEQINDGVLLHNNTAFE